MMILAIESASLTASVALTEGGRILSECTAHDGRTHSETLLPMISECFRMTGRKVSEIDALAVSMGPGSFTGLRIGASTAKGLAFALDKPVIPVPTLDAAAYHFFGSEYLLVPILDARRGEVYTGLYEFRDGEFVIHEEASAKPLQEQMERAAQLGALLGKKALFLGDGLIVHEETIRKNMPEAVIAPLHMKIQRASGAAALGEKLFREGHSVSALEFLPLYLRESQAEQDRRRRGLPVPEVEL